MAARVKLTALRERVLRAVANRKVWQCGHFWALYKAFDDSASVGRREDVTAQVKWLGDPARSYVRVSSEPGSAAHCSIDRLYELTPEGRALLDAIDKEREGDADGRAGS